MLHGTVRLASARFKLGLYSPSRLVDYLVDTFWLDQNSDWSIFCCIHFISFAVFISKVLHSFYQFCRVRFWISPTHWRRETD